jgi:hypothetical protein
LKGRDVGDVGFEKQRRLAVGGELAGERGARLALEIDESYPARLRAKARTMSAPMPLAPPLTNTTRPARLG